MLLEKRVESAGYVVLPIPLVRLGPCGGNGVLVSFAERVCCGRGGAGVLEGYGVGIFVHVLCRA